MKKQQINEDTVSSWISEDEAADPGKKSEADELIKKFTETQLRVVRSSMDLPLQTLKNNIHNREYINIAPSFQRRGRWDEKKRSLLIESFLLNIPIPPIFLFENKYNQYEVMDGRQRLESLYEFLDNGFPLTDLEYWGELNKCRYKDLPETIQRGLLRRTINAVVLLTETNNIDDVDIRMILFRRLNTGGIQLNPHELRNALYPSEFNEMLKKTARHDLFTTLWNIPSHETEEQVKPSKKLTENLLYKTMLDCELVLRYFAIQEAVQGKHRGSLRTILDKTLFLHQEDKKDIVDAHQANFLDSLSVLKNAFGSYDYLILPDTKRLSRPLYDALTVATSIASQRKKMVQTAGIKTRLKDALENSDQYEVLVGRANTLQAIKDRVALAYKILTTENFV